jgi:hypothetical protein
MKNETKAKVSARSNIAFRITPEEAMELIRNLASFAADGKTFDVNVHTQSDSWDKDYPVAVISVGGFHNLSCNLKWATTGNGEEMTVHYNAQEAKA